MTINLPTQLASTVAATQTARAQAADDSSATSSSDTTDSSSMITSSDFLTLLVAEMKNQDPTQPSDPTQYVQQLVGVNSLEQLIDINEDLTGTSSTSTTTTGTTAAS